MAVAAVIAHDQVAAVGDRDRSAVGAAAAGEPDWFDRAAEALVEAIRRLLEAHR